jgi:hypothetical protein
MFKKGVGSFLAVSLLTLGSGAGQAVFASTDVQQGQQNNATLNQSQAVSGLADILAFSKGKTNKIQLQLGAGQGQAGSATGVQVQAASTSGPAAMDQSQSTGLNMSDTSGNLEQSTDRSDTLNQGTSTTEPSQVVQGQIGRTSAIQSQASVAGGPTIQHQMSHRTSIQYNVAVKTVAPK